jgi:hypothetical protein
VGPIVLVVVLPPLELVAEDPGVVDRHPLEKAVGLFGIDAVGAFHFAIQAWGAGLDVAVAYPLYSSGSETTSRSQSRCGITFLAERYGTRAYDWFVKGHWLTAVAFVALPLCLPLV